MVAPADLSTKFALDVQAVNGLRVASKTDQAGLEAAARQFEALFLGMMLKSMREATPRDSLMDSEQSRLYMSMLDQQLSQSMAARGVGLAEIMMRQLRDALPPEVHQPSNTADAGCSPAAQQRRKRRGYRRCRRARQICPVIRHPPCQPSGRSPQRPRQQPLQQRNRNWNCNPNPNRNRNRHRSRNCNRRGGHHT